MLMCAIGERDGSLLEKRWKFMHSHSHVSKQCMLDWLLSWPRIVEDVEYTMTVFGMARTCGPGRISNGSCLTATSVLPVTVRSNCPYRLVEFYI
jgi:hypothetical protein